MSNAEAKNETRFREALRRFDEANAADPTEELVNGVPRPRELVYAEWLTAWVRRLCAEPSEALLLAARCQHLCRWEIPRHRYELTRAGYLRWRNDLKQFHAEKAEEILREVGYPEQTVARVQALNLKKDFPRDAESRLLEDALCLVFLEHQFADLASRTSEDKMINALQKSWRKMTPQAQEQALQLRYGAREKALLERALGTSSSETRNRPGP